MFSLALLLLHHMPYSPTTLRSDASLSAAANASALPKSVFWDRIARKYAADPIADIAGYVATLQRVQALLSIDHEVLEIGCGTGSTALRLAPGTRRLMATDVSSGMIAIAREKLAVKPVPQLSFAVADADAAEFGKETYDAVLAFNLLHLVDDLDRTIAVAARSLKPGGLFISKTACISEMNPLVAWLPALSACARPGSRFLAWGVLNNASRASRPSDAWLLPNSLLGPQCHGKFGVPKLKEVVANERGLLDCELASRGR